MSLRRTAISPSTKATPKTNPAMTPKPHHPTLRSRVAWATLAALAPSLLASCLSSRDLTVPRAQSDAHAGIQRTVMQLYRAFDFAPDQEPDWQGMTELFMEGASFVAPLTPGQAPAGVSGEDFVASFAEWVRTGEYRRSGLHERVVSVRIDAYGAIGHAWVTFEGYLPETGEKRTLGLDSLQLVRDGTLWKVASFSTQYATDDQPLPARFQP